MTADRDPGLRERPLYLRPGAIGLVAAGGTVGTLVRAGSTRIVTAAVPGALVAAAVTMVINIVGAFLLGWLLAALSRRGSDTGRRRRLRLALGTGMLGGFTTYSTLAVDVAGLGGRHAAGTAVLLAAATLVLGLGAAALGLLLGGRSEVSAR